MINSRKLEDLHPRVKEKCSKLILACQSVGIDILVTSTYRDHESQNALYAQGRTSPGNKVTNAKGGESFHNYRLAFDVVPLVNGKPVWDTKGSALEIWNKIGALGVSIGLEWAGNWKTFKEFPHFQFTEGLTLKDLQAGKMIKN